MREVQAEHRNAGNGKHDKHRLILKKLLGKSKDNAADYCCNRVEHHCIADSDRIADAAPDDDLGDNEEHGVIAEHIADRYSRKDPYYRRQSLYSLTEETGFSHRLKLSAGGGGVIFIKLELGAKEKNNEERDSAPKIDKEAVIPFDSAEMADDDLCDHIHRILGGDCPAHGMTSESAVLNKLETHGDADALHKAVADAKSKAAEEHHCHAGIAEQSGKNAAYAVAADTNKEHIAQGDLSVYKDACNDREDNCTEVRDIVYKSDNAVRNIREYICDISQRGGTPLRTAGCGICENQNDYTNYGSRLCRFIHL